MPSKKPKPLPEVTNTEVKPADPATEPEKPKVKFTVTHNVNTGRITIIHSHPIPPLRLVCSNLPAQHRKLAQDACERYGWSSPSHIEAVIVHYWGVISPEDWVSALCTSTLQLLTTPQTATLETSRPIENAFLSLGDALYSLKPVAIVGTAKALSAVRKRATAEAQAEVARIVERAHATANEITQIANNTANEIYHKVDEAQNQLNKLRVEKSHIPPEWLIASGFAFYLRDAIWYITFGIQMRIERFDNNRDIPGGQTIRKSWRARPASGFNVRITSPISHEGSPRTFSITSCKTLDGAQLPHITSEKSCMAPGDCPPRLDSVERVISLTATMNRVFRIVDLNSLLTHPQHWDLRLWPFVPPDLEKTLRNGNYKSLLEAMCVPPPAPTPPPVQAVPTHPGELVPAPVEPPESEVQIISHATLDRETWQA